MKKLPKSVTIMGKVIPVKRAALKGAHGEYDRIENVITVNDDCPDHLIDATLMHECMHAILWLSGMSQLISDELEEGLCFATEHLTSVYKTRETK